MTGGSRATMTDTFQYPQAAAPAGRHGRTGTADPIQVAVAEPVPQRRLTVAFRFILLVPQLIVLYGLGIAAFAVLVIGWLGAVFTGRLPGFAARFLSGYLHWYARVEAYQLLLTDQYPPFMLGDADYPVRLAVSPGRLSRLTVLFRLFLAIPALVVVTLLGNGLPLVTFAGWLTALVTGRLPSRLHQAFAATLRYLMRCSGYLYLLTGSYPGGLFGDRPGLAPADGGPGYGATAPGQAPPYEDRGWPGGSAGYGQPTGGYGAYQEPTAGYGTPGYGATGYGTPGYGAPGYGAPAYPAAPPPGQQAVPGDARDAGWQLVLSSGAKRLVVLILALGLLPVGAQVALRIAAAHQRATDISRLDADVTRYNLAVGRHDAAVSRQQAAASGIANAGTALSTAHSTFSSVLDSPATDSSACSTVSCFDATSVPVANGLAAYGRSVRAISVPPGSAGARKQLMTAIADDEKDWTEASQASSFDAGINADTAAEKDGGRVDNGFSLLMQSLNAESGALDVQAGNLDNAAKPLIHQGTALGQRAAALGVRVSLRNVSEA